MKKEDNWLKIRTEFIGEMFPLRVTDKIVVDGSFTVDELRQIAYALEIYQKNGEALGW